MKRPLFAAIVVLFLLFAGCTVAEVRVEPSDSISDEIRNPNVKIDVLQIETTSEGKGGWDVEDGHYFLLLTLRFTNHNRVENADTLHSFFQVEGADEIWYGPDSMTDRPNELPPGQNITFKAWYELPQGVAGTKIHYETWMMDVPKSFPLPEYEAPS